MLRVSPEVQVISLLSINGLSSAIGVSSSRIRMAAVCEILK